MQDFNRRIINEAIKYGAKPRNFHDIGIKRVTESQWDENRDGWEGKPIEEASQTKIGKVTFTPFKEGSISGYMISIEGRGEVGFIEEPAKKNTKTSVAPFKVFYNGKSEGNPDLVLSAWPGSETRQLSPKEIRFKPRGLLQAVAEWMAKNPPK